ncbi:hypothetical protein LTS18_008978 [Coniosporium uncinatum]|uniref:Uncharacterized protein n=1 Tax=Coniosporium uncinatum TaxID=93489 RepID=A0ACC3DMH4_9PEZI|nr:hypothetical protein LTS18_008978 [Coniosporium uncinatum]
MTEQEARSQSTALPPHIRHHRESSLDQVTYASDLNATAHGLDATRSQAPYSGFAGSHPSHLPAPFQQPGQLAGPSNSQQQHTGSGTPHTIASGSSTPMSISTTSENVGEIVAFGEEAISHPRPICRTPLRPPYILPYSTPRRPALPIYDRGQLSSPTAPLHANGWRAPSKGVAPLGPGGIPIPPPPPPGLWGVHAAPREWPPDLADPNQYGEYLRYTREMKIWAEPPDTEEFFFLETGAGKSWMARRRQRETAAEVNGEDELRVVDPDVDPEMKGMRRIRIRGLPVQSKELAEELKALFAGVNGEVDWIACWEGEANVQFFRHSKAKEMLGGLVGQGVRIMGDEVSFELVEAGMPVVSGLVTYRYLQESWLSG